MHGRGHAWWGGMCGRVCVCVAGGMCGRGACLAGEMATAADGTHPTGMHSCYTIYLSPGPSDLAKILQGLIKIPMIFSGLEILVSLFQGFQKQCEPYSEGTLYQKKPSILSIHRVRIRSLRLHIVLVF